MTPEQKLAAFMETMREAAEKAQACLAKYAKGRHPSKFFGGPLDGHEAVMSPESKNVGVELSPCRSARYALSANGDYFFLGWQIVR